MIIYTRGTAKIEHSVSKEIFEIFDDELEWEVVGGDERGMGQETIYEAFVDHDDLGDLRWSISEYPLGVENFTDTNVGVHRIVSDFDYGLEHQPDFDEEEPIGLRNRLKANPEWATALTRGSLVKLLVDWFHYLYEDPANETPYNGREGGYLYIKGGPYNAEEELRGNFEDIVPEEALMAAVEEIQSDGLFDWAPSPRHQASVAFYEDAVADDYQQEEVSFEKLSEIAASEPSAGIGSAEEKAARVTVLEQISALKDELPKPASHGGIGHNHPPEEFELHGDELEEAAASIDAIEAELVSNDPSAEVVAKKASLLKDAVGWVAGKINTTVDAFCKSFGMTLGAAAAVAIPAAILASPYWAKLVVLLGSLKSWLLVVLAL
ncbi:hypothetical protein WG622_12780 [Cognatishimia sp. D5M38]|uniref:Uncharacterized protein n=1 Tax=Cognatishimia coralii TaxID=3083254 RepID=A0ABU8QI75_9RHOB